MNFMEVHIKSTNITNNITNNTKNTNIVVCHFLTKKKFLIMPLLKIKVHCRVGRNNNNRNKFLLSVIWFSGGSPMSLATTLSSFVSIGLVQSEI